MEVSYELLWKICSGFLLSFLVSGLVSLILYCSNSTLDDEKIFKSSINGGKKKKRVKFLDQVDVIRSVDDGFVKDIEVDEVNRLVGVQNSGEKGEILMGESGGGCLGLVDLFQKGKTLVGFDGDVDVGVSVGVCLGSDAVDDKREENSLNSSMELGSGENEVGKIVGSDVHVSLGGDELVDDLRERNSMTWNNVYEEEEVHGVDRADKIVGCDVDVSLCSEDLVGDYREQNSSKVYEEEEVHDVDRVYKVVGCDVSVSMGSASLVDDHRERNVANSSSVYEEEVHEGDRVDNIVGFDDDVSLDNAELVDGHREGNLANSSINVYEEELHEVDRVDKVSDVDVTSGSDEVVDKRDNEDEKIVDGHNIDLFRGNEEVVDDQRGEEAKVDYNVGSKERSGDVFNEEGMLNDEEEWEGIERSDLAMEFARAKCFVENDDNERRLAMAGGNDLMMQLYGLEKVAMEGPCHEPQPMALKFASRAKWNAWQKLGNMSPEEAMEQYISVLSQNVPKWMEGHSSVSCVIRTSKVSDLADVSTAADQDKE